MKTILRLLLFLLPLYAATACGDDEPSEPTPQPESVTLVSSLPATGATNVDLSTKTITLTYSAEVNFASGMQADFNGQSVALTSFAKSTTTPNVMTFTIPASLELGQSYTLSIPEGFFTSKASGDNVPAHSVTFSTKEKTNVDASSIATSLVTPSPSKQAKALYDYLLSIYGQKILSSTIANVNWNLDEADMVNGATGKYPAIATFDYIHSYTLYDDASRNPYKGGWRINYDDISQLAQWWEDGGIVSGCWHWNVPNKQSDKYGQEAYTCTPGSGEKNSNGQMTTLFRPKNIFVDGSWEKQIADQDLELIASLLKKFQEANIPVIWRPLHEASGNATMGGTAWFWWGIDGAETYVRLWRYMFDYFKSQGINNLIWVWTTQTGYGYDPSKGILYDTDWYPGDEYVDIIGRDEYTKTAEESVAEFDAIRATFPNKMITLSECGDVAKLSDQFNSGALWSWAMPWYDYDADNTAHSLDNHQHANTAWWTDAMNCNHVVSRDQLPNLK